ncbi:hypothetical protein BDY21DRAFT_213510 [Lineolata rhizophorae]|uniref:Uncharacterized protein n=1 Tax=Lineolata rhizophorae TaxID=578093 RepID=A0A6A6P2U0_9PEZI|nr:hypothetical protein BDY21DRAFT_213510 [Lineolata rhizophorae]
MAGRRPRATTPPADSNEISRALEGVNKTLRDLISSENFKQENDDLRKQIRDLNSQLAESRRSLEESKDGRKADLVIEQHARGRIIEDFQSKYKGHTQTVDRLKQENETAKRTWDKEHQREVDELGRKIQTAEKCAKQKEGELHRVGIKLEGYKQTCEVLNKKLKEMEEHVGFLELDDLSEEFQTLSVKLKELAEKFAGRSLPEADMDKTFAALEHSRFSRAIQQPVPVSNGTGSKLLRAAAFEAIVAEKLSDSIFRCGFPWPKSGAKHTMMDELLRDMFDQYPLKEPYARAIIVSAQTEETKILTDKAVEDIINDVESTCKPLLNDCQAFRDELENFLNDAVNVWNKAQRSRARFEPEKDPSESNFSEWVCRAEYGEVTQMPSGTSDQTIYDVIFPQIWKLNSTEGSEWEIVLQGVILSSDQQLCIDAKNEYVAQMARFKATPRRGQGQSVSDRSARRHSRTGSNASYVYSPTSPTLSNQSHLNHHPPGQAASHQARGEN